MIAYGAVNGQILLIWACKSELTANVNCDMSGLVGTYVAGMMINVVVLTSFASILFLLSSIPLNIENGGRFEEVRTKYYAGYDLFLVALLGTAVFVVSNSSSIYNFTVKLAGMSWHVHPLADLLYYEFWLYVGVLVIVLLIGWCIPDVAKVFAKCEGHSLLYFLLIIGVAVVLADVFAVLAF